MGALLDKPEIDLDVIPVGTGGSNQSLRIDIRDLGVHLQIHLDQENRERQLDQTMIALFEARISLVLLYRHAMKLAPDKYGVRSVKTTPVEVPKPKPKLQFRR